jgi:hypothetical protein
MRPSALSVLAAAAISCGAPNQPAEDGSTVALVAGTLAPDTVLAVVRTPLRFQVRDDHGDPAGGVALEVSSVPTGSFDPSRPPHLSFAEPGRGAPAATLRIVTAGDGTGAVSVSRGTVAGAGVMRVAREQGRARLDLPWEILPGSPVDFDFAPYDTAVYRGAAFRYRIEARDRHRNPLSGQVTFEPSTADVSVSATGEVIASTHGRALVRGRLGNLEAVRWISVVPRFDLVALADGIILTESDGHDQRRIAGSASAAPLDSWPNAARLVVGKNDRLLAVPISGQGIQSIATPGIALGEFLWPRFDPSGTWIYVSLRLNDRNGAELWRVRSDGTAAERLTALSLPTDSDVNPHPSPDGTRVVFSTDRRDPTSANFSEIAYLDLATGSISYTSERGFLPRWSPDGTRVGFLTLVGEIRIINVASGAVLVTADDPDFTGGLDWSPDGDWLVAESILGITFIRATTGETIPVRSLGSVCCVVFRR